jgi:septal ring factor EnvC (AmiA/AmiB activator)
MEVQPMLTDEAARQLHDRATRGMTLSADEQAELNAWYARQDAEEAAMLAAAQPPDDLSQLRSQLDDALSQIAAVTQRIREQTTANEQLKREINELKRQLSEAQLARRA